MRGVSNSCCGGWGGTAGEVGRPWGLPWRPHPDLQGPPSGTGLAALLHLVQKNPGNAKPWDRSLTRSVWGFLSRSDAKKSKPELTREHPSGWERPLLGNLCGWTAVGSALCRRRSAHPSQSSGPICPLIKAMPPQYCSLLSPLPLLLGNFLRDGHETPLHVDRLQAHYLSCMLLKSGVWRKLGKRFQLFGF